jgi:hypothetical protein
VTWHGFAPTLVMSISMKITTSVILLLSFLYSAYEAFAGGGDLTPQEAASLATLRAQRAHAENVRSCRYCRRQFRGNALGFHEKRCPRRPMPQPQSGGARPAV